MLTLPDRGVKAETLSHPVELVSKPDVPHERRVDVVYGGGQVHRGTGRQLGEGFLGIGISQLRPRNKKKKIT